MMRVQLIVWGRHSAHPTKGWQARVGSAGPGETRYFAAKKFGYWGARRLAEQAQAQLERRYARNQRRRAA